MLFIKYFVVFMTAVHLFYIVVYTQRGYRTLKLDFLSCSSSHFPLNILLQLLQRPIFAFPLQITAQIHIWGSRPQRMGLSI